MFGHATWCRKMLGFVRGRAKMGLLPLILVSVAIAQGSPKDCQSALARRVFADSFRDPGCYASGKCVYNIRRLLTRLQTEGVELDSAQVLILRDFAHFESRTDAMSASAGSDLQYRSGVISPWDYDGVLLLHDRLYDSDWRIRATVKSV